MSVPALSGSPRPDPSRHPDPPRRRLRRVNRTFPAHRAIVALILREMSTRYGRSPGGYVWAILEPLGSICILAFGFSLLLRTPSLGNSFILFYASGFLPFTLFNGLSQQVAKCIGFSRALLFYPAVTWIDAALARFVLNALTGVLVTYILLFGILQATDTRAVIDIGPLIGALGMAMVMGFGVGLLNCALSGLFPIWNTVWSIATRPLFLISGVIFIYEDMPVNVQAILWWNPLMHVTGLMRHGVYPTYDATYVTPTFVLGTGLVCLVMGLILMGRYHREILND